MMETRVCVGCGVPFETPSTGRGSATKKFCTHRCSVDTYGRRHREVLREKRTALRHKTRNYDPYRWYLYQIKATHGLDQETYEKMLHDQNDRCAICHQLPKYGRRLQIDHDHSNGKVRALLCEKCNRMIGFANDQVEILESAIRYLAVYS